MDKEEFETELQIEMMRIISNLANFWNQSSRAERVDLIESFRQSGGSRGRIAQVLEQIVDDRREKYFNITMLETQPQDSVPEHKEVACIKCGRLAAFPLVASKPFICSTCQNPNEYGSPKA